MDEVCVLMTCYNPNKYTLEQIASITNQQDVKVTLIIRDDASTDTSILEQIEEMPDITVIRGDKNLGVVGNIISLVQYAAAHTTGCKYYAYSDQDDVWKDDKLITGIRQLKKMNESLPCLYYSNLQVVDETLSGDNLLFKKDVNKLTFSQGMAQIFAFACTFVFNDIMLNEILAQPAEFMAFDHLVNYIALIKGQMFYDEEPHILYRQHGNNISYDKSSRLMRLKGSINSVLGRSNDISRGSGGSFRQISEYLLKYFKSSLTTEQIDILNTILDANTFAGKVALIRDKRIRAGYYPKELFRFIRIVLGTY